MAVIAPPENLQSQSALLQLPAEIKHIIYGFYFITEAPIGIESLKVQHGMTPHATPGASLLQTCRRIYHEADRRPLFAWNTFSFLQPGTLHRFLLALPVEYRTCIQDIEIDMRNLDSDCAREWLRYLTAAAAAKKKNQTTSSSCNDAAGLKCVRLNLEAWPVIPMFRIELWGVLRSILSELRGLERIVVTGASRGGGMGQKPPCSPVHFVGGDDVGANDLLFRMSKCVLGDQNDDKIVKWTRQDGKIELEVLSRICLRERIDKRRSELPGIQDHAYAWPLSGSCSVFDYLNWYRIN